MLVKLLHSLQIPQLSVIKDRVAVTYAGLTADLNAGDTVLVDDGLIGMKVKDVTATEVICEVLNNGDLGEKKGVNLPGVSIGLPALAEKDKEDLIFGCEQGVDFVAASFIRKRSDVEEIRAPPEKTRWRKYSDHLQN
ncbi:Pyruvate kinase I [Providencia stuartii]|nr:Pyruvate kinase I [Providencia stuartii]